MPNTITKSQSHIFNLCYVYTITVTVMLTSAYTYRQQTMSTQQLRLDQVKQTYAQLSQNKLCTYSYPAEYNNLLKIQINSTLYY